MRLLYRDSHAPLTIFTATLQHFYETFMTAPTPSGILCVVCQDDARGRSCNDTTPSTVAAGRTIIEHDRAGWMAQDNRTPSWLHPERVFVVQFYADTILDSARMAGRVEHVV
jgi:hypothetical protein